MDGAKNIKTKIDLKTLGNSWINHANKKDIRYPTGPVITARRNVFCTEIKKTSSARRRLI
jgi:hypothetical protein